MAWLLAAVALTAFLAAVFFIRQQERRHTRETRRLEGQLREALGRVEELTNKLMYALDKPWQVPTDFSPEIPEGPIVYEDFGPEMVEELEIG